VAKIQELVAVEKGLTPGGLVTAAPQTPMLVRAAFSDSQSLDAFGRLRTSAPVTLFDSRQFYGDSSIYWENAFVGTGAISAQPARASVYVQNGGTLNGAKATRQSRYNFLYQAGRSLAIFETFVLGAQFANCRKRVGFFNEPRANAGDGVFLEQDGTNGESLVLRTSTSGSASDANKVLKAAWNIDPMDGSGPSGITLDFTKTQIMVIDLQYLGVGRVRVGWDIFGVVYPCHEFRNANNLSVVYMRSPDLNVRYEIENTGASTSTQIEHICSAVMVEGGAAPGSRGVLQTAQNANAGLSLTTRRPILSVRAKTAMNSQRNRGHIFIEGLDTMVATNPAILELVLNGTLTGGAGTWIDISATESIAEYNTDRTTIAGGRVLQTIPVVSGSGSTRGSAQASIGNEFPLVYTDLLSVQDTLSIVATAQTNPSVVFAAINWKEYY
jgi:hypothetical protein